MKRHREYKAYVDYGREQERIQKLLEKKQKIEMLEAIIHGYEIMGTPDYKYLKKVAKRLNDARAQLKVLSTIDPEETAVFLE